MTDHADTIARLHDLDTPEVSALRSEARGVLMSHYAGERVEDVFATLWVHVALIQARLAVAEGVVTRCGWCGGPLAEAMPCRCRFCGGRNAR